jgi:hypothetical protein
MGAALATKVTTAPWIVLPIFMICGWSAWGAYALATLGTCAVITIPAWPMLGYTWQFYERIVTHSGRYGLGPPGLFDRSAYGQALVSLLANEPVMVAVILAALAAIWVDRRRPAGKPVVRRALAGLVIAQLLSVLLVARHPGDIPFDRYLIPALGLVGTTAAVSWTLLAPVPRWTAYAFASLAASVFAVFQASAFGSVYRGLEVRRDKQEAVVAYVREHYPDSTIVYVYRASNQGFALVFGDELTHNGYAGEIASAYPRSRVWNIWAGGYENGSDDDAVQLFQGDPGTFGRPDWKHSLARQVRPVFGNDVEELCELR